MSRLNVARKMSARYTHEGARAVHLTPEKLLRRLVGSCLLWEDNFYVDGQQIAELITETARKCNPAVVADLAVEARTVLNLRHVPLLLVDVLSEFPSKLGTEVSFSALRYGGSTIADTIVRVIQRADELAELLAIHWRNGRKPVPHQMRKGLAAAFHKFKEYHFAKYDRDGAVKLRDALRIARPRPVSDCESALFARIKNRTLKTPDTWEVELSSGKDKRETFERLIREGKLGYLALLRNLRNMEQAGCDYNLVAEAILAKKGGADRVLPFRYVAAVRAAPQFAAPLGTALLGAIDELPVLRGVTGVLVDVSGSMDWKLSARSDLTRADAACALASLLNCEQIRVASFSARTKECPAYRGLAGVDAIRNSQGHTSTDLRAAVAWANKQKFDRLIVISDEQTATAVDAPKAPLAYMINVASYENGVGYNGPWVHLDGFSEGIIRFIQGYERGFE